MSGDRARFGLTVAVHPELARIVKATVRRWRKRTGAKADGAQYSPELEKLLGVFVELCDGDVDRIMEAGTPVVERFHKLPPDYDPDTWRGERPLVRRENSVFGGSGVPDGATTLDHPIAVRRGPGAKRDRDKGAGQAKGNRGHAPVH